MSELIFDTHGNEKQKLALKCLLSKDMPEEIGYGGGAGGGKSYTIVAWQWMMRNTYPGTRGCFGRNELKRLKQTTLATYWKFCDEYKIPVAQRGVYNQQDSVIRFANGSEILLIDLAYKPSDPLYERLGSLELTDGAIDESGEVDEMAIQILSTRIGRYRNSEYGIRRKILETFNPNKGHVNRRYYIPHREKTLPEHRIFIPALVTDNKKIDPGYIEALKRAPEQVKQRLLYGNFEYDDTPGALFAYPDIMAMRGVRPSSGVMYISIDVARSGDDATKIYVWDGLLVVHTDTIDEGSLTVQAEKIKAIMLRFGVPSSRVVVDEQGVGGGLVDILNCKGFVSSASPIQKPGALNKNFLLREVNNYMNLKAQCYHMLSIAVKERKVGVDISDTEFSLLSDDLQTVYQTNIDKDGKYQIIAKDDQKRLLGRSPDSADAMMMRMVFELSDEPIYAYSAQELREVPSDSSTLAGYMLGKHLESGEEEEEGLTRISIY